MSAQRIFIDWKQSFLPAVKQLLVEQYTNNGVLDLSNCVLVFTGSRSSRRLIEMLLLETKEKKLRFEAPKILTVGNLPEELIKSKHNILGDLERRLVWSSAIKKISKADRQILSNIQQKDDDFSNLLATATQVDQLYSELSGACINFKQVANVLPDSLTEAQILKWEVLAKLEQEYLKLLALSQTNDHHQLRFQSLKEKIEINSDLFLVGAIDLPKVTQALLRQVSSEIKILIPASETFEHCFSDLGSIEPKLWLEQETPLEDNQIICTLSELDQIKATLQELENCTVFNTSEITIACGNEDLIPYLKHALTEADIPCRSSVGEKANRSSLLLLLELLKEVLSTQDMFIALAFIRHPYVLTLFSKKLGINHLDLLRGLESYQSIHLQSKLNSKLPGANAVVKQIFTELFEILDKFKQQFDISKQLLNIKNFLQEILTTDYIRLDLPEERKTLRLLEELNKTFLQLSSLEGVGLITNIELLQLILSELNKSHLPNQPVPHAIDLLGWLELPLDDAPCAFLLGCNDQYIPGALNSHIYLPNSTRRFLGLIDNDYRFARDNFLINHLVHSRKHLRVMLSRVNLRGDTLLPSRFLFNTNSKSLVERVQNFFASEALPKFEPKNFQSLQTKLFKEDFNQKTTIETISVSDFKTYLRSPYEFYLKKFTKISRLDDEQTELDARQVGNIIHEVLYDFSKSASKDSMDGWEIFEVLSSQLDREFTERFGDSVLASVKIQKERLLNRLREFAFSQAEWRSAGNEIRYTELSFSNDPINILTPSGELKVVGRIDRIDYNPRQKTWYLFDYKTGESVDLPSKEHRRGTRWIDLQLPCYRKFYKNKISNEEQLETGYIRLTSDLEKIDFQILPWKEAEYAEADLEMTRIADLILQQKYLPTEKLRVMEGFELLHELLGVENA